MIETEQIHFAAEDGLSLMHLQQCPAKGPIGGRGQGMGHPVLQLVDAVDPEKFEGGGIGGDDADLP